MNWKISGGGGPFTITPRKIQYLGINLTKWKTSATKKDSALEKKIKEDIRKWKNYPCSWTVRRKIVQIATFPKLIQRFNAILTKISTVFFTRLEKETLNFIWNQKTPRMTKQSWSVRANQGSLQSQVWNYKATGKNIEQNKRTEHATDTKTDMRAWSEGTSL